MALIQLHHLFSPIKKHNKFKRFLLLPCSFSAVHSHFQPKPTNNNIRLSSFPSPSISNSRRVRVRARASRKEYSEIDDEDDDDDYSSSRKAKVNDPYLMDAEERREWRQQIRQVMAKYPDVDEVLDDESKRQKMQKLLEDYPLVVEEDDPNWPEDADGWGFSLSQFFNKITIKNKKKDDDDENYDSDKEIVWHDDNYIRPIKDIKSAEWEEAVFKDISPLIVLVHNRYKRPKENEKVRDELEKAVNVIWNCRLPSPRIVAIDAVVETDLVSALKVSVFPEIIFTKAGKILYREKVSRSADEFSKIMAYFYYGAGKPPCLNGIGDSQELIPSVLPEAEPEVDSQPK